MNQTVHGLLTRYSQKSSESLASCTYAASSLPLKQTFIVFQNLCLSAVGDSRANRSEDLLEADGGLEGITKHGAGESVDDGVQSAVEVG